MRRGLVFFIAFIFIISSAAFAAEEKLRVENIRYGETGGGARIVFDLNRKTDFRAFVLDNPYRIVVDLPSADWKTYKSKFVANNIVKAYRSGVLDDGLTRVIFDIKNPAIISDIFTLAKDDFNKNRLVIDLKPASFNLFNARKAEIAGILPAHIALKLTMEPEEFREHGVIMGGGGIVFIDDSACIVDLNIMFSWFLEDESCGRCTTCHGGTQRMTEIFQRIARGGGREDDYNKMQILGQALQWSNCVHGSASPTIMLKSAEYFREEIDEHILRGRCPAKVCRDLIRYEVHADSPKLPEAAEICPTEAVVMNAFRFSEDVIEKENV